MKKSDSDTVHLDQFFTALARLDPGSHEPSPPAPEGAQEPAHEGFSEKMFLSRMLGDKRLAKEVASLFLSNSPNMIGAVVDALSLRDPAAVSRSAQALKGSAGSIGADAVYLKAKELQSFAKAKRLDEAERVFPALLEELNRLRKALVLVTGKEQHWKIVIAEDDASTRKILQSLLVKWGHTAVVCANGSEALKALQQPDSPKMAILDWMMPEIDGVEVCRRLRKSPKGSDIYILMLTSRDSPEDIIEALDAGADDYATKPFDAEKLKTRLAEGLRRLGLQPPGAPRSGPAQPDESPDETNKVLSPEGILVALKKEIAGAHAEETTLGVAVAEVDDLTGIFQRFGGSSAEAVMTEIVRILHDSIPPWGQIGRMSAAKFLLLASGCDRDRIVGVAEKVSSSVASSVVKSGDTRIPVTITVGVTVVPGTAKIGVESAILAAESALHLARNRGGNRVSFSPARPDTGSGVSTGMERLSPHEKNSRLDFQLIVAARNGDIRKVSNLLKAGADVNARDKQGNTALIEAAFYKYPELVDLLLAGGSDPAAKNNVGDTALTEAVRAGHKEVAGKLLEATPIEPNDLPILYRAMFEASTYGKTDVVALVKSHLSGR